MRLLDRLVRRAYAAACENGYKDELDAISAEQLTIDMMDRDSEVGIYDQDSVERAVQRAREDEWRIPDQSSWG